MPDRREKILKSWRVLVHVLGPIVTSDFEEVMDIRGCSIRMITLCWRLTHCLTCPSKNHSTWKASLNSFPGLERCALTRGGCLKRQSACGGLCHALFSMFEMHFQ